MLLGMRIAWRLALIARTRRAWSFRPAGRASPLAAVRRPDPAPCSTLCCGRPRGLRTATVIAGALVGDIERTRGSALDPRKKQLRSMFTDCEAKIWTVGALGGRRPRSGRNRRSRDGSPADHTGHAPRVREHQRGSPKSQGSPIASGRTQSRARPSAPSGFSGCKG